MENSVKIIDPDVDIFATLAVFNTKELEQYLSIMGKVGIVDVSSDCDFQREFNYFYKLRRNAEWRKEFYRLFEDCKSMKDISFERILYTLYERTGNIEASFSSKLLATLNPDMPIWDSIVLSRFGLKPSTSTNKKIRLENTVAIYQAIVNWYQDFLQTPDVQEFLSGFNEAFPEFSMISATKKVDFILWGSGETKN